MTEDLSIFFRGFIIGISIAAPVGPIGLLCIRRTLSGGRMAGFLSGLGAATADMIYGSIAAFGLSVIMKALIEQAHWLRLVGGIFLLYLGMRILLSKPAAQPAQVDGMGLWGAYLSTLFLTLTNPMTILAFIAIFAGILPSGTMKSPIILVAGVLVGSAFWWLALSLGVGILRERLGVGMMQWINRLSGAVIMLFGLLSLFSIS